LSIVEKKGIIMLPSEAEILAYIDKHGYFGAYVINSTDFPSQYIVALFKSLRKRRFLSGNNWLGFHLTKKGREYITNHHNGKNGSSNRRYSGLHFR